MASPGHEYLPELARCFAGEVIVFSWSETFQKLQAKNGSLDPHTSNVFISSPKVRTLLSLRVPLFPSPSQQARSQYETKTAAINVTPSPGKSYDIEGIKKDTIWLSDEVKLAEDEALRIVVLEWQQRPTQRLIAGYSDAEMASLRAALGGQDVSANQVLERVFPKRDDLNFESEEFRRLRLLDIYFEEQIGLLGVSRRAQEMAILKDDNSETPENLRQFVQEFDHAASANVGITELVDTIELRLQALGNAKTWSIDTVTINDQWIATELRCLSILQELLLLRIRHASETVSSETLVRWLQIMANCEFFVGIQPGPLLPNSRIESLQTIASITTLAMMDPATAISTLADSTTLDPTVYFLNGDVALNLHTILLSAAEACVPQASPSALAWALILSELKRQGSAAREARESGAVQRAIDQGVSTLDTATGRRTSSGSLQQSLYEDVVSSIMNTSDLSDPAEYILRCTIEAANVFETMNILANGKEYGSSLLKAISLQILQELLFVAVASIGYTPEVLNSQFAILATSPTTETGLPDTRETFINTEYLMDNIFAVAAGRFPYESLPFLRLCKFLANAKIFDQTGTQYIAFRLKTLESFTQSAVGQFASYHTVREDENLNLVVLEASANMFRKSQKRLLTYGRSGSEQNILPADTLGEVISESASPVIRWRHSYSGLALIGTWLELHYLGHLQSILPPYEPVEDIVTECICIVTSLLQTTCSGLPSTFDTKEQQRLHDELLEEINSTLQADSDITDYIFEILEQELQAYRRRPSNTFNTSVLVACIRFAAVFSQIRPDRFWSSFSKSSLLESYGSDSFLLSIISGVEVPNQKFSFLESCAHLYQSIIQAILQQNQPDTNHRRAPKGRKTQPHSLRLHANVLSSLTQSLLSAFEAIPSWSFVSKSQQSQIVTMLATAFEKLVIYSNTVEPSSLTASFNAASELIVQQIQAGPEDLSSTNSIIRHTFRLKELDTLVDQSSGNNQSKIALQALLTLSKTIIKLKNADSDTSSSLEQQLLNTIPLISRSLSSSHAASAISLIQALLDKVARHGPVSLLGHLGSTSAIDVLEILKLRLGDWTDNSLKVLIWDLLAKLVGRNQQWLAIVILTGSPPGRTSRDNGEATSTRLRGKSFMEIALKHLSKIIELDQQVAISILKFVIKAQMNWSWADEAMKSDRDFLPSIMSYVCNTFVDASDDLKISHRNRIAALVTDLATIHLHHAKAKRDTTTLKTVAPLLKWLATNAINVASYNHSLHTNLRKNFASKFGSFELNNFKRTGVFESTYGENYYYDLTFAHEILKSQQQWDRHDRYRDQSFSAEFRRANLNLSIVDSEVRLLNSFLNLCLEHSGYFAQDSQVQDVAIDIVDHCLTANTQAYPSEKIFDNVLQTRADICISLLQRLVDMKARGIKVRGLLKPAWECARMNNGSFEQAITDNTLKYWRSMLAVILFSLQFHVERIYMPPAADSNPAALLHYTEQAVPTILEIITVVVGQGYRSVAATLQDQKQPGSASTDGVDSLVSQKDVYFILTIFETILRMTRLPEFISEASQRLIVEGTIQSCLMLYSWSHTLTGPEFDDEPIYAVYCLRFLASMSSLPLVTEELAVEGVLSRLLSSRITQKLQSIEDGATHLDTRPHVQVLYSIWATGLLPVCLNLLSSVGAPVAAEVSIFLNQFSNQLNMASVAFIPSQSRSTSANVITSVVANEAAILALISYILNSFRNAGASAAVDPSTVLPLVGYDEHKKALSEDISDIVNSTMVTLKNRIQPINEREVTMSREGNGEALVEKILSELRTALTCLKGGDTEEDK